MRDTSIPIRRRREAITLWIDQICINQADNGEKSEQVGLIGSIYLGAKQVLVWLGHAGSGSDALIRVAGYRPVGSRP
ncbi:hypothetical protein EDB81DRAFT_233400 [Dactylonectria macrodidyma]|uniref:Heterokaryon incompatibility domain-containing protein n=1 Tax=Dactylonectria macrodidyma TaxID=307937 RepID=A0A9P9IIG3_9HYPO|nr:hypothetical protein EDB81DRAFT_233400 [Dactylonectria macrodidyma]